MTIFKIEMQRVTFFVTGKKNNDNAPPHQRTLPHSKNGTVTQIGKTNYLVDYVNDVLMTDLCLKLSARF